MGNYVEVKRLDYSGEYESEMSTKTYHGLQILVDNVQVGRINTYTPPGRTKVISHIREFNPSSFGKPIETVPGATDNGDYKISVRRAEVWGEDLEIAFGFEATFSDLTDQNRPFVLEEKLFKGNATNQVWQHTGSWFSNIGFDEFVTDSSDAIIKTNAEITFTSRGRLI